MFTSVASSDCGCITQGNFSRSDMVSQDAMTDRRIGNQFSFISTMIACYKTMQCLWRVRSFIGTQTNELLLRILINMLESLIYDRAIASLKMLTMC